MAPEAKPWLAQQLRLDLGRLPTGPASGGRGGDSTPIHPLQWHWGARTRPWRGKEFPCTAEWAGACCCSLRLVASLSRDDLTLPWPAHVSDAASLRHT